MTKLTTEEALEVLQEVCFEKDSKERLATLMAIDALSTQMPKRPKKRIYNGAGNVYFSCPRCERTVSDTSNYKRSFCPTCGQALDWSDNNAE